MSKYVEKITIPGDEYTLLPKEELPNVSWARQPGYIERVKQLPHDKHLLGDRWEVLLREENTPRHVVRPRLSWRTDVEDYQRTWLDRTAEYHRQRYHWSAYRTHFVYDTVPPMYDPETHTIIHTSSLLGPVALASQLQSRDLTPDFITLVDGKLRQYWSSEPRPAKAAGYLVGLLQSQFIETQLFGTPGFQAVNKHVKAVTAPRG